MYYQIPVAILRRIALLSLVLAAICPITSVAVPTYYFPGSNINYTGGSNSFPLNSTSSNKCQFLYKTTDFNALPSGPFMITTVYIKPSSSRSNQSLTNLTIKLGNSTLTTLSSSSWVSGLTTVYNPSSVTISTTANQWFAFTLSTPFLYTGGNLVFELSQANTSAPGISINQYVVSGRNGRVYGNRNNSFPSGASTSTALFGFDGVPAACSGTPSAASITTAPMNPASPLCAGSTMALSASNPNGAVTGLSFQWQSGTSSTGPFSNVSGGSGATTLNYTTGPLSGTTWFRVGIKCSSSNITTYSSPYQVIGGAQQPGTITGRAGSCMGDTATYSVPAVAGHSYAWTLPSGWTGSSSTNSILVTMGASPGTISVTATGCGGTSIARTRTITTGNAPGQPTVINGSDKVCAHSTQTYTTPSVAGASSYTWTLPSGWTGTSVSNTISATAGSSGGTIKVKANNGCGSSSDATKSISVISSLASPGTITSSASGGIYCSGSLYSFSINPVPGATTYVWSLPSGWSGTASGTSMQAFAGNTGQISVTAYVSCATSPTSNLAATVSSAVTPSVSVTANASVLCQGRPITFTATPTNGGTSPAYVWKKNGVTVLGTGNTYLTSGLANGDVISVDMSSNAQCRASDTVSSAAFTVSLTPSVTPGISINANPVISICEGTRLSFNTIRTGGGSAPTYQWLINGMPITGATDTSFSSAAFQSGDTLSVQMTTNAVCATMPQTASNKVSITVKDTVHPTISVNASSLDAGQPITFTTVETGGGPTPAYQWILNNVEIPGASEASYTSNGLSSGDRVHVRMQSYAECASPAVVYSDEVIIGTPTSVGAQQWNGSLSLFPNPNGGTFTIASELAPSSAAKHVYVDVYNVLGQRVYHAALLPEKASWKYEVQLDDAAAGRYNVRVTTDDGMSANIPMMITR